MIQVNKEFLKNENYIKTEIEKVKQEEKQLQKTSTTKVITKVIDPEETYILEITANRSKHEALKTFLETNGMSTKNHKTGKVIVE